MIYLLKTTGIFFALFIFYGCAFNQNYAALHNMVMENKCEDAVNYIQESENRYGSNDNLLFLLDSAMINMQCKNYENANRFFHQAEALAEKLWTESISKNLTAMVTNDFVLPYAGEDFERVLINLFSAVSYLELKQKDQALVECRRIDSLLSLYNSKYIEKKNAYKEDGFARYLSGIIYESDNSMDDAYIDYKKAYNTFKDYKRYYGTQIPVILKQDLYRVAQVVDRTDELDMSEDWNKFKTIKQNKAEKKGKLVIIHLNGLSPVKAQRNFVVPTKHGNIFIAFPEYRVRSSGYNKKDFIITSQDSENIQAKAFLVQDINKIAIRALEDRKARIWTKAIARSVVKQAAIAAISQGEDIISIFLNTLNNIAIERADTRSWKTLPAKIYMAREFLEPGKYNIYMQEYNNEKLLKEELNIKPGETEYVVVYTIY